MLGVSIGHRHKHVIATFCLLHDHRGNHGHHETRKRKPAVFQPGLIKTHRHVVATQTIGPLRNQLAFVRAPHVGIKHSTDEVSKVKRTTGMRNGLKIYDPNTATSGEQ